MINTCMYCEKQIVPCNRCRFGHIHSESGYHACADKIHMATPQPEDS